MVIDIRTLFEAATDTIDEVCFKVWMRDRWSIDVDTLDDQSLKPFKAVWKRAKQVAITRALGDAIDG